MLQTFSHVNWLTKVLRNNKHQLFSRIWPSRVETCRKLSRIKIIYILAHYFVFIILYDTVQGHGTH
jgi:hypothetical protein